MLPFAILLVTAANTLGSPASKILPVYEPAGPFPELSSWCAGDCPRHVLVNPVLIVSRDSEVAGRHTVSYSPPGLNGLTNRSDLDKSAAIAVFPVERFPFDKYPELKDSQVHVPQHSAKMEGLFKAAPVIVFLAEGEVAQLQEALGLVHAADLSITPQEVTVAHDYGRVARQDRGISDIVSSAASAASTSKPGLGFAPGSAPMLFVQCS